MTRSPISLRVEGAISIITIDDGKTNVVGQPMSQGLGAALDDIDHRQGTVVIEGREGLSSAGFDSHVVPSDDPEAARRMLISGVHAALKAFDFSRPIVATGTGHAVATGAIFNMGLDGRIGRADWRPGELPPWAQRGARRSGAAHLCARAIAVSAQSRALPRGAASIARVFVRRGGWKRASSILSRLPTGCTKPRIRKQRNPRRLPTPLTPSPNNAIALSPRITFWIRWRAISTRCSSRDAGPGPGDPGRSPNGTLHPLFVVIRRTF